MLQMQIFVFMWNMNEFTLKYDKDDCVHLWWVHSHLS